MVLTIRTIVYWDPYWGALAYLGNHDFSRQMIVNTAVVPRPRKFKTWKPTKALQYPEWCLSKCPMSKDSREGFAKWFISTTPRTSGPRPEGPLTRRAPAIPFSNR